MKVTLGKTSFYRLVKITNVNQNLLVIYEHATNKGNYAQISINKQSFHYWPSKYQEVTAQLYKKYHFI